MERAAVSILGIDATRTLFEFWHREREAGLLVRILMAYPREAPAFWTEEELPGRHRSTCWSDLFKRLLEQQAVSKAVPAVSERLKKAADHLPEPSEAINQLRSLVEERPLTAILCATGIEVLAALCFRR